MRRSQLAPHAGAAGRTDCSTGVPDIVWRDQGRHASWTPLSSVSGVWGISHPRHRSWQGDSGGNGGEDCNSFSSQATD